MRKTAIYLEGIRFVGARFFRRFGAPTKRMPSNSKKTADAIAGIGRPTKESVLFIRLNHGVSFLAFALYKQENTALRIMTTKQFTGRIRIRNRFFINFSN